MLCDICGKNQATVHLTEIIDEKMNELHLCEECARQKSSQMESQFGLSDLLAGLAGTDKSVHKDKDASEPVISVKCPNCGLTYADFKKIGRLGCGDCYTAFKKYLGPLLKRIHGASSHFGKAPVEIAAKTVKKKTGLEGLRKELQEAIAREAFEDAARLRDKIKETEKKQEQGITEETESK